MSSFPTLSIMDVASTDASQGAQHVEREPRAHQCER
jgi:hypothetical protein